MVGILESVCRLLQMSEILWPSTVDRAGRMDWCQSSSISESHVRWIHLSLASLLDAKERGCYVT
jgi:hypothetical protein